MTVTLSILYVLLIYIQIKYIYICHLYVGESEPFWEGFSNHLLSPGILTQFATLMFMDPVFPHFHTSSPPPKKDILAGMLQAVSHWVLITLGWV